VAYWTQRIHRDALMALRSLSGTELNSANILLDLLQVDPRPAGATEQDETWHVYLVNVHIAYEIDDENQVVRVLQINMRYDK